ncbi:hypothetical protein [uncultured Sphingomonas sp.]|jgi:hypothetical protein|uniref:hypothetical protein n=1 Tax=uncultured Sphingomonas sp. TaxID=158754 RepID=UPI0025874AC6|nr:hypothetical protein [uncultured Sphingomonas sp.]
MIAALFAQAAVTAAINPPADWSTLAPLPIQRPAAPAPAPALSQFVRDEVAAGRCSAAMATARGHALSVDLAVLVGAGGQVRRIVPRAIGCATVEQYASGIALNLTRAALRAPGADTWYRTSVDFAW